MAEKTLNSILRVLSVIMERDSIREIKLTEPDDLGDVVTDFPDSNKLPRFLYAIKSDTLTTVNWLAYEAVKKFRPENIPYKYRWSLLELNIDNKGKPVWLPFLEGRG